MIPPLYPAALGLLLVAAGALGFAVRRGDLAAVVSLQVMGLGGLTVLLAAAQAHRVDGQAVALLLLGLLCIQGVLSCALVVRRHGRPPVQPVHWQDPGEIEVEEMKW